MSNVAVIYASDDALSADNQTAISVPVHLGSSRSSFQICYDGGGTLYYQVQVTNLNYALDEYVGRIYGTTQRDDSYASPMWLTLLDGTTKATSPASEMVIYPEPTFEYARVLVQFQTSNAAGSSCNLVIISQVSGSD